MLAIDKLSWGDRLHDISLAIGKGEIVGLGGLDGQGQRELLLALFGVLSGCSGTISIDGRPVHINSPRKAKSGSLGPMAPLCTTCTSAPTAPGQEG